MGAVIENTVEIARSPVDVFDYLADQENEIDWNPDCLSVERLSDGPLGVGTRFRAKWQQGPPVETECTRFDRPRAWQYRNGGRVSVVLTVTLEPTPSGGTRMVSHGEWAPHGWFTLVFPVFIRIMRRGERRVVDHARRALEERRDLASPGPVARRDQTIPPTLPPSLEPTGSPGGLLRFSGIASLMSAAVAGLAVALFIAMFVAFGLGMRSAGQAFGAVNDGLTLVAYVLAVPGVAATIVVLRSRRTMLVPIAGFVALAALAAIIVLQWQLVSGMLDFEQQVGPVSVAFIILGGWFVLSGYLGRGILPYGVGTGVLAALYVGYPVLALRLGRYLRPTEPMDSSGRLRAARSGTPGGPRDRAAGA